MVKRGAASSRDALMEAGMVVFADEGFDGATAEAIAERAGVNKAMINYHFGGKEGLYKAILRAVFEPASTWIGSLRERGGSPERELRDFIDGFARMMNGRPSLSRMLLREVLSGGRHLDEEILPHFLGIFARVREIVAQGIRQGEFRRVDPLMTHLTLVGSLVFFFATAPLRVRLIEQKKVPVTVAPSVEEFIAHIREFATRALAAEPRR